METPIPKQWPISSEEWPHLNSAAQAAFRSMPKRQKLGPVGDYSELVSAIMAVLMFALELSRRSKDSGRTVEETVLELTERDVRETVQTEMRGATLEQTKHCVTTTQTLVKERRLTKTIEALRREQP